MEHELYLNGQYLKTVEFPGFPLDVHWLFYLGDYRMRCVINYGQKGDYLKILFYREGDRELEGYYGTVSKEIEKKIRRRL